MKSRAFTLVLGTIAAILTAACASTEKNGRPMSGSPVGDAQHERSLSTERSMQNAVPPVAELRSPGKSRSPSAAPRIDGKGQDESPSSSAENRTRDAVESSIHPETGITPLDQSEQPNDLEITRRIRQAVIQDDSLSFKAKNVMIVTNRGRVALTGLVNTRAEAERIKGIAQSITPYHIEDRLEIRR